MPVTLAPGVSLRPGSSTENIVQPVVDAFDLILRPFSNAQTSPVFQVQNVDGSAVHFGVNPAGDVQLAGGVGTSGQVLTSGGTGVSTSWTTVDLSTLVSLAPNTPTRNTIQPTADTNGGLIFKGHSVTQSAPMIQVLGSGNVERWHLNVAGSAVAHLDTTGFIAGYTIFLNAPSQEGLVIKGATGQSQLLIDVQTNLDGLGNGLAQFMVDTGAQIWLGIADDASNIDEVFGITPSLADVADATWKGRASFDCGDFNKSFPGREFLRGEADGTAARISVLGGVAAAPRTAAYTITNANTRRSFDTTTVSLSQLAEVVGTIVADQQSFGWFG